MTSSLQQQLILPSVNPSDWTDNGHTNFIRKTEHNFCGLQFEGVVDL
jgi:hypothetical protein